jgi:hypothetical protein
MKAPWLLYRLVFISDGHPFGEFRDHALTCVLRRCPRPDDVEALHENELRRTEGVQHSACIIPYTFFLQSSALHFTLHLFLHCTVQPRHAFTP